MFAAFADLEALEQVVEGIALEDAHCSGSDNHDIAEDVVVELDVEGDAGCQVIEKLEIREYRILGLVAGKAVEMVITRPETAHLEAATA